jgi:hypothetical protein
MSRGFTFPSAFVLVSRLAVVITALGNFNPCATTGSAASARDDTS